MFGSSRNRSRFPRMKILAGYSHFILGCFRVNIKLIQVKRLKIVHTFVHRFKIIFVTERTNFPTPPLPNVHFPFRHKMAGILKVAAFFGICTAFAAVLIAWSLKGNFVPESVRGKKVVICGASTGIGEELAYQYAKLGAKLLLVARREEALQKVVARCEELGAQTADYVVADLSSLEAAKNLAAVRNAVQLTKCVLSL